MKNKLAFIVSVAALVVVALACNASTANLSSLKMATDKEGTKEASSFKTGDTIYGRATVANNPGKVKVKLYLAADDVKGMTKGETLKGSEVTVDIDGDGVATYNLSVVPAMPGGKYTATAEMINDAGEKKDSKTASITVASSGSTSSGPSSHDKGDDDH